MMSSTEDGPALLVLALDSGAEAEPRPLTTAEHAALTPRHRRILRAALAMRGGVSLAVWTGGALAEIDLWRRIRICRQDDGSTVAVFVPPSPEQGASDGSWLKRAVEYARMLDSRGFDAVEFDVMAGASGGGLNAVMYAVAQRAGASVDSLLDTWRDVGSAWRLMHPPGFARLDAVFRGDRYLWVEVRQALRDFYDPTRHRIHEEHRAERITVDLSATIIDNEDANERGPKEGKGHFHFVGTDDGTANEHGRDIPARLDASTEPSLARLAYAARATSAFPVAFEPALIFSRVTQPGIGAGDAGSIDMTFAFHAHREDWSHPFRVVDGGVFDNIPIDRAFRAIRGMASTVNATRALLYLDPNPPIQSPGSVRPTSYGIGADRPAAAGPRRVLDRLADPRSRLLEEILAGQGERGESREKEEDEVERFRLQLAQADGRAESLAEFSAAAVDDYDLPSARWAYVRFRGSTDLQLLTVTLANPSLWQLGTNLPSRQNWPAWSPEERSGLAHSFATEYAAASHGPEDSTFFTGIARGPQAVVDTTLCALDWVRTLEELPDASNLDSLLEVASRGGSAPSQPPMPPGSVAALRRQLYALLARGTDARDRCLREALDDAGAERRTVLPRRAASSENAGAQGAALASAVVAAWVRASARAATDLDESWRLLDACLAALRAASSGSPSPHPGWVESPYAGIPSRRRDFGAGDLAPFLASTGIPEPISSLSYWRITGNEPPSKPEEFTTLIDRKVRVATVAALALPRSDLDGEVVSRLFSDGQLASDEKLAGSSLANFAGFLSKHWRSNDWWWGRLDASAGMVRFLEAYPPRGNREPPDLLRTIDTVQSAVLDDAATSDSGPFSGIPGGSGSAEIRARFAQGGDSLDNLEPGYLVAILSRTVRVASRAFSGSAGTTVRLLLAVLRPLLVFLPLARNPLRQALVAAVLGGTITITAATAYGPALRPEIVSLLPGSAILAVIAVLLIVTISRLLGTWTRLVRLVREFTATRHSQVLALVLEFRREAAGQCAVHALSAVATLAVAAWVLLTAGISVPYWILVASAAVLAARAPLRARSPSEGGQRVLLYGTGFVAYAAWVAGVVLVPGWIQSQRPDPGTLLPATVAAAGFLIAVCLTLGWLPIVGTLPRTWLINWLSISVAAGAASAILVYGATHLRGLEALGAGFVAVLVLFVWGSLVWWLPEIPEGTDARWRSYAVPDDLRRTYSVHPAG
jgi:patatin-related protein